MIEALIVSRNEQLITFLSAQLALKGLNVLISPDQQSAIDLITRRRPLLVFAETKADDIEALSLLRAVEKKHPELSVVAISRAFDTKEALASLRRGLADYIALPLEGNESLIQKAIHRACVRGKSTLDYMSQHDALTETHSSLSRDLRQLQEDHEAGRYVQSRLFPATPSIYSGFEFTHKIIPSLYLSGDFIDYMPLNEQQVLFYFADISGHGASSGFITILLKLSAQRWVDDLKLRNAAFSPREFIAYMNREMIHMQLGKHMTLFCGLIDAGQNSLTYSLAAHYPPPILKSGKDFTCIPEKALPVGVFENAEYPEKTVPVADEFALFLFSDGLMEVLPGNGLEKKEKYLLKLCQSRSASLDTIGDALGLKQLEAVPDDIGLLMIKRA